MFVYAYSFIRIRLFVSVVKLEVVLTVCSAKRSLHWIRACDYFIKLDEYYTMFILRDKKLHIYFLMSSYESDMSDTARRKNVI